MRHMHCWRLKINDHKTVTADCGASDKIDINMPLGGKWYKMPTMPLQQAPGTMAVMPGIGSDPFDETFHPVTNVEGVL